MFVVILQNETKLWSQDVDEKLFSAPLVPKRVMTSTLLYCNAEALCVE